jgi:hypothetical protein
MDELKIEPETHNDNELKSPISEDAKHERISLIIPAVKCEADVSHVLIVGYVNVFVCVRVLIGYL